MEAQKRMDDLSFEEILKLEKGSPEALRLIDIECAHAGISLLPENPGPEPKVANCEEDTTVFKVADVWFDKVETAQAILDLIIASMPCKRESVSGKRVMVPLKKDDYYFPKMETSRAFTTDGFKGIADSAEADNIIMSAWKAKKKEYDDILAERKEIVKSLSDKWNYALEVTSAIKKIKVSLNRYLDLAQGSYPIAVNFLADACKDSSIKLEEETVYYVCTNGQQHFVISREEYQNNKMHEALEVTA